MSKFYRCNLFKIDSPLNIFLSYYSLPILGDFSGNSDGKASVYNAGDPGSIPGSGRSPGEGNGNPLQYSCLANSMDAGAWWATVHGVPKSQTRLSDFNVNVPILKKFRYFL